jgi:ABC-2 type transport system permease protein
LLAALLTAGLIGGLIAWGFNPVTDLSRRQLGAGHALGLAFASIAVFALPLIAVAAFGIFLSVVTRNSAAAIVGTVVYALVMEALAGLVHLDFFRHYMLSSQLDAWHGLFQSPIDWTPVIRGAWVSAVYTAIPLTVAFAVFGRRDVSGE